MFYRPFIFVIVLALSGSLASAERPFATVKPNTGTETDYKFDTNNVPVGAEASTNDLNYPPNIVFTPDSQKGFVSFPGSDKILVFRPSTGEILATIAPSPSPFIPAQPVNPGLLALTPDGKKLYVALAGDDETAVIDTESMTVTGRIHVGNVPKRVVAAVLATR